jgi:hypothetical protein
MISKNSKVLFGRHDKFKGRIQESKKLDLNQNKQRKAV